MNHCETCKHYEECSEDLYHANIEREYFINWCNKDCWESNKLTFLKN